VRCGNRQLAERVAPIGAALLLLTLVSATAKAQAGPPFLTDDPETPGNRHWEINLGFTADHNPAAAYYQVPDFDFNYGLGDRIQLKYELPISLYTNQNNTTLGGLGESLLGVKWRYYEHRIANPASGQEDKPVNFSLGTYPQLSLNNPTSAVRRGIVLPGPQFLLPLEANGRIGWLRWDGDYGYWFSNRHTPQYWTRGIVAGHEFSDKTELYLELHDFQDANRINGAPKMREFTLGAGGRQALNHDNSLLLMFMGGRSLQTVTPTNGQPSWIAYLGLQLLLGPKPENRQVEKKVPDESRP
jgi:hypothetical protein